MSGVELQFGVEGGGSLSGASGNKIRHQLQNIIGRVNKQLPGIKITLDTGSITNCENQLKKLTKTALEEADKIQSAYKGVNFDVGDNSKGGKSGGGRKKNPYADVIKYNNALAKSESLLKQINSARTKWTAAGRDGSNVASFFRDLSGQSTDLDNAINKLKQGKITLEEFNKIYSDINARFKTSSEKIGSAGMNYKELDMYKKRMSELNTEIEKNEKVLRDWSASKTGDNSGAYKDLEDAVDTLKRLQRELSKAGDISEEFESDFASACNKAAKSAGILRGGDKKKTFGDKVIGAVSEIAGYIDVMDVAFRAYETGRKMVEVVTDIDTAMTELKKVTDETDASYNAFLEEASTRAKDLGATVSDVVSSSADFARLGYDLDEASALSDAAIVYKNVGDGIKDIETASSSIISTMQAFGIEASDAMSIVDSFNAVGNNFAISSGGIGDALLNSAASLHAAGNDIHESVGLIAAANTTIQDPGRVGTALKTMSMYLRAAKTEAEDAGISTEGMADSVSQLRDELMALTGERVDIMSDVEAGSYKSTVEILRELSDVWDDLSDTSRTNITELIGGGVRNANIISALMNNFSIVEDAVATSMKSSGSALIENEKHLDSIAGKTQKFNAAFETMAYTMVDNDLIKGVIDAGTMLLNGATWIGDNLGGAIALFAGGRIIDTLSSLDKVLDKNSNLFKFFQSAKSAGNDFKDMFRAIKLGVSDFKEMAKNADGMRGVFEALSKTGGNIWGNLSKGSQFAIAGLGIGTLISAVSWANEYREKQILLAQESAESYTDSAKAINDYKEESLDLIRSLDAGVLSNEEQFKAKTRLNEIEQELVATYGAQADQLDLLSKSAQDAETSFDSFAAAKATEYLRENRGNIEDAKSAMTQYRANTLGVFNWSEMSADAQSAVQKIVDSFDNVSLIDSAFGKKTLTIAGDNAQEMLDIIDQVNAKLNSSGNYVNDHFNSNISSATNALRETVDTYGSQYNAGVEAAIAASSEYTGIMKDIEKAESKYTKTMSDSYDSTADRARAMSEVQEVVNATVQNYQDARASIAEDDSGVADYFDAEIANLEEYQNILNFGADLSPSADPSEKINDVSDALNRLRNESGELDADYINKFSAAIDGKAVEDLEGQERAYWDLTEALSAYGLEVADAIPLLKAFGIIRKSDTDLLGDATNAYNAVIAESQAVASAYASQAPNTSVSLDSYRSLITLSDEYADCLEYQNGQLQLNRQKLMDLSKARANENLLTIQSNKLEAQNRYAENAKAIEDYQKKIEGVTDATADLLDKWKAEKKALESKNETIRDSIIEYSLMAEAIESSISSYSEWVNAQSETQSGAWHASASSGLAQLKELYKNKEYGNTVLQEGLEFFTGANITGQKDWKSRMDEIDKAYSQLNAKIDKTSYSLSDFMQGGSTGANNFLRAVQQLNGEWASFDQSTQEWTLNYDNEQLATALGTTEEFVVMMNGLLEQYGFEFDSSKLMTTEEKSIKEATDLVEKYKKTVEDTDDLNIETVDSSKVQETEAQVADIATQLAALPKETLVSLGFNFDGVDDANIAQAIQEQLPNISLGDKSIVVPDATAKVNYELGEVAKPTDATVKVHYELGSVARPTIYGGQSSVSGTAKFNGDVGTAPGGRTLVGELGREMYVDPATNTWRTIGDNGAEFVNLPRNAIVFNHMQTASLLSNGRISARGKALVSGNAAAMVNRDPSLSAVHETKPFIPITDAVTRSDIKEMIQEIAGVKSGGAGNSTGKGPGSGSNPKSGEGSSKKKKKKKKQSFEDLYKKHNHLREMDKETDEKYLDWLEDAYKEAYKKGEISLDDYRKYAEEVYELQKELFQDSLNDMEHEISILEREAGNESKIIVLYRQMMTDIEKEIKNAKKRGLDENSDYIQDLQKQYYDYADEISEIEEEITENATDAVEELVDLRIDMIKQGLEDEKDALDEKLDDLRDFYDKQKEMLQDAYDEEKYLEEQREKRKTVSDIQASLDQLALDDSAWAQKRKLELQEELNEAQKDLDDFEKDHALDTTQDFLDKMYEKQADQIQSQIDAIDEKLNDPNALYNQALADIKNNTAALYEEMIDYNNKHGDGRPETVQKLWDEAYDSLKAYLDLFGEAYKDIVLVGNSGSISGYAVGTRSAAPGLHRVDERGAEYLFTSSDGSKYRVFSGGEKMLNASATNFLYDFATSGGRSLFTLFDEIARSALTTILPVNSRTPEIVMGDIIVQGNADQSTVSAIRREKREEIQWILKEFNKMNRRA